MKPGTEIMKQPGQLYTEAARRNYIYTLQKSDEKALFNQYLGMCAGTRCSCLNKSTNRLYDLVVVLALVECLCMV